MEVEQNECRGTDVGHDFVFVMGRIEAELSRMLGRRNPSPYTRDRLQALRIICNTGKADDIQCLLRCSRKTATRLLRKMQSDDPLRAVVHKNYFGMHYRAAFDYFCHGLAAGHFRRWFAPSICHEIRERGIPCPSSRTILRWMRMSRTRKRRQRPVIRAELPWGVGLRE